MSQKKEGSLDREGESVEEEETVVAVTKESEESEPVDTVEEPLEEIEVSLVDWSSSSQSMRYASTAV